MKEKQPCRCGCGQLPQGRRTSWFSAECVHRYLVAHDHAYWRAQISKRDKGVCSKCGIDCRKLVNEYWRIRREHGHGAAANMEAKYPGFDPSRDYWQADHILARCLGGTNTMENGMTLCVPCHKIKTKNDRRLLKEKKNSEKTVDALTLSSVASNPL